VIAVLALVGKALMESGSEMLSASALGLSKAVCSPVHLVRMGNLFARGEREQVTKAWINTNRAIARVRNGLRLCVDAEAEIPARGSFDDTATCDPSCGDVLGMEPRRTYTWDVDARALWRFEGIRKRDAGELIALAFESGFLSPFLIATLPRGIRRVQHALQGMTGDTEFFAMTGELIMEGFLAVIDTIPGILLDLTDGPIPDPCKVKQPGVKLAFLRCIETQLELPLDHLTPAFDWQCIT